MTDAKKLEELEKEIAILKNERTTLLIKKQQLEELEVVKDYKEVYEESEKKYQQLSQIKDEYSKIKQRNCNHPVWFLLNKEKDSFEGRTYYTCKCLECLAIVEDRGRYFDNVITGNFFEVLDEYNESKKILLKIPSKEGE